MTAADLGDGAEGAGVVAALGDLEIRGVLWREAEARRVVIWDERGPFGNEHLRRVFFATLVGKQALDDRRDLGDLIETDEGVDLGHRLRELLGETLRHAAGDNQLLLFAAFAQAALLIHLEDALDGFLLG